MRSIRHQRVSPLCSRLRPTNAVNQSQFILAGFLAVRTVIDYPNGLGSFFVRLVRPFERSERVAWASAEADEAPAPERPSALEVAFE